MIWRDHVFNYGPKSATRVTKFREKTVSASTLPVFFLEICCSPSSPILGHNWKHDLARSCFILKNFQPKILTQIVRLSYVDLRWAQLYVSLVIYIFSKLVLHWYYGSSGSHYQQSSHLRGTICGPGAIYLAMPGH